jgi:ABC-2 type transport system permease protein
MSRVAERLRIAGRLVRFLGYHLVFNLQVAMEYRVSFATQIVFMVLNDILLLFFWWILFQRLPSIGGWSRNETMLLVGVAAGAFGLGTTVAGNVSRLCRLISDGQLDVYLLLPRDPLFHAIIGRMVVAGIGDLAFGLGVLWLFGPESTQGRVLVLLAMALGGVIFTAFGVLAHTLAFFLGNSTGLSHFLHESLLALGMYPESIYPAHLRFLLFTVIPVGFTTYVPIHLVKNPDPLLLLYTLVFTLLLCRLSWMVFQTGLVRYQSGSLTAARL